MAAQQLTAGTDRRHTIDTRRNRSGFTLVELLVVIGIIAILIAILMPALNRARQQANTVKCLSNLKQFGAAIMMYANDNKGFLVPGDVRAVGDTVERETWATILVNGKYLNVPPIAGAAVQEISNESGSGPNVFRCPEGVDNRFNVSGNSALPTTFTSGTGRQFTRAYSLSTQTRIDSWYGLNGWPTSGKVNMDNSFARWPFQRVPGTDATYKQRLHRLSEFKDSTTLVLLFDGLGWHNQVPYAVSARHNGNKITNVLLADGHCASIQAPGDIPMDNGTPRTLKEFRGSGIRFMLAKVP